MTSRINKLTGWINSFDEPEASRMVRAKFRVDVVNETPTGRKIIMQPQFDQTIPEDQRYAKATPSGRLEMQVDNPIAFNQFTLGKYFYLDFTLVE